MISSNKIMCGLMGIAKPVGIVWVHVIFMEILCTGMLPILTTVMQVLTIGILLILTSMKQGVLGKFNLE